MRLVNRAARASWFGLGDALAESKRAVQIMDWIGLVEALDFTAEQMAENRACLERARKLAEPLRTCNWYLPYFHYAFYGGVHTILRFAVGLQERHGVESRILIYDRPSAGAAEMKAKVTAAFPSLAQTPLLVLRRSDESVPEADAAVATFWTSAFVLMKTRNAKRKFYFIQDYEPLFYPAGSLSALAEQTYRFGFPGIVNTPGLRQVYEREFGVPAISFVPATDPALFYPPREPRAARPFRIFFYGRPDVDRNAFEIGAAALRRLQQRRGVEVDIVVAGSDVPATIAARLPGLRFLGRLPYAETGPLYRSCHAGLVLMLTRHPSYLPLELMSCGAVPVANVNPTNSWLLQHERNALVCEPSPTLLAGALERLLDDAALRRRLADEGERIMRSYTWDDQIDDVFRFMSALPAPR